MFMAFIIFLLKIFELYNHLYSRILHYTDQKMRHNFYKKNKNFVVILLNSVKAP